MIRDALLGVHAAAWLIAVTVVALRTGEVPPALWTVLPLGISGILVAFRTGGDDRAAPRHRVRSDLEDQ
jgi:hypothetical protein